MAATHRTPRCSNQPRRRPTAWPHPSKIRGQGRAEPYAAMYARSRTRPDAQTPCAVLKRDTETTRTETEIVDLVKTRIPRRFGFDAVRDIQVLCPMNRGGAGARSLNIELQAALNPAGERKVERFGWTFAPGDKVLHIVNDYGKDVCNGDTGQVADVDPDNRRADRAVPRTGTRLRLRADAGLRRDGAQEPGLGVSGRRHPDAHPALRDAAAKPALHRGDSRQAPGGARRAVRNAAGRRRWSRLNEWLRNLAGQRPARTGRAWRRAGPTVRTHRAGCGHRAVRYPAWS